MYYVGELEIIKVNSTIPVSSGKKSNLRFPGSPFLSMCHWRGGGTMFLYKCMLT